MRGLESAKKRGIRPQGGNPDKSWKIFPLGDEVSGVRPQLLCTRIPLDFTPTRVISALGTFGAYENLLKFPGFFTCVPHYVSAVRSGKFLRIITSSMKTARVTVVPCVLVMLSVYIASE